MVSKRNQRLLLEKRSDKREFHYGLRKLSVGVASVLLMTSLYLGLNGVVLVHADTVADSSQPQVVNTNQNNVTVSDQSKQAVALSQSLFATQNNASSGASSVALNSSQIVSSAASNSSVEVNTSSSQSVAESSQATLNIDNENTQMLNVAIASANGVENTARMLNANAIDSHY